MELALQSHALHQEQFDSGFIPYDDSSGYNHPAFGLGATPDLYANAVTAGNQGTLAGRDPGQDYTPAKWARVRILAAQARNVMREIERIRRAEEQRAMRRR